MKFLWQYLLRDSRLVMAEVAGQFAGVEVILQQADTRAFVDGKELGTGLLSVEER